MKMFDARSLGALLLTASACGAASNPPPAESPETPSATALTLLRNATMVVEMAGKTLLVDPFFGEKGAYDPFPGVAEQTRNPMVGLPVTPAALDDIVDAVDAVLVTHTHLDHWDPAAQALLLQRQQTRGFPLYCQPEDQALIRKQGFADVRPVSDRALWEGITLHRTGGQHGLGALGEALGPVSGYVLDDGQLRLYLAGDTVWCDEVQQALETHQPDVTVLNTGGAEFETGPLAGGPITMTPAGVIQVQRHLPGTRLITVHMETLNHCPVRRPDLQQALAQANILEAVEIPDDGQRFTLTEPARITP